MQMFQKPYPTELSPHIELKVVELKKVVDKSWW